jgi:hypothetical protein
MVTYCPAVVRPMRWQDPEPEELCSNEVEEEGQYCPQHEEQDDYNPWGDD